MRSESRRPSESSRVWSATRGRRRPACRAFPGTGRRGRGASRRTATPARGTARPSLPGGRPAAVVAPRPGVCQASASGLGGELRPARRRAASAGRCGRGGRRAAAGTGRRRGTRPGTPRRRGRRRPRSPTRGAVDAPSARRSSSRRPAAATVSPPSATISTAPSQSGSVFAGRCSSSTAWKLLPPNPNADSAARRGWSGPRQPRPHHGVDVERRVRGPQRLDRLRHLDRRRQHLVVQGQRRLDERRRPGRRLGVADLRLDRADRAPRPGSCVPRLRLAAAVEYTSVSAATSTASPTLVPVPWASTSSIVSGVTPASR